MLKLYLLTHHVTPLVFPGNCCFEDFCFSFVFVVLPAKRSPAEPTSDPHPRWVLCFTQRVLASLPWRSLQGERGGCEMGRLFTVGLKVNGETHRKGRCTDSVGCDLVELKGLEESVPSHRTVSFMGTVVCWKSPGKERSAAPRALGVLGFGETKGAF